MTVRKIGGATIEKVEELCAAGFRPNRMFPKFNQEAFDAQKGWMAPGSAEGGWLQRAPTTLNWLMRIVGAGRKATAYRFGPPNSGSQTPGGLEQGC